MTPPTRTLDAREIQIKNELFPEAMEQFILQLTFPTEDALVYKLTPEGPTFWNLFIPHRIFLGEISEAQEKIYRDQPLPTTDDFKANFESFFGKYAHKNVRGEVVAMVRLITIESQNDDHMLLYGKIEIDYGPLLEQCPFPTSHDKTRQSLEKLYQRLHTKYDALFHRNYVLEQHLERVQHELSRHVRHMTLTLERWHVMLDEFHRRNQTRHGHMQRILLDWYADRPTREDCCVCWHPMEPTDLRIPQCGHFICTTCHEQCTNCPVCRDAFDELTTVYARV